MDPQLPLTAWQMSVREIKRSAVLNESVSMHMYQVDAFTDRLFAGNPAAVLVLDEWLPDDLMLAITQENNLAETAFVKARSDGAWDLRWFAPAHEVNFCGHATLATAHVLLTETNAEAPLVFHTRVGELRVTQGPHGYRLDIPRLPPEPLETLPAEIARVFDNPPVGIFRNFENIFADLGSADAVRSFAPDLASIARLGSVGLVVTGQEADNGRAHFVSRYFAPRAGIPEDPVTGSIHATLVPYWVERLGRERLMAYQASARGGWLDCELTEDRVFLVGNAVTFMKATVSLPNGAV
ncbi:PhzF family phenazine biosynthesis protein [Mesorhizobium silamurunense]|uniref:PhzF family phenazine biosynthesis protein n=1 Tax=Mesorhizobium silamurunense TaxID=499528 RepID=UPI0028A7A446|nr:PhzF family phenazine biosynthesis protein [Mesorhizobium silamurunense]